MESGLLLSPQSLTSECASLSGERKDFAAFTPERTPSWTPPAGARLLAPTPTRLRFPLIGPALGARAVRSLEWNFGSADGVLGWGDKTLARFARYYAERRKLPYWTVEDGFIRSVGLGKRGSPPVSLVIDDLGIHFSARTPSRLECLLETGNLDADLGRARDLRSRIVEERLSKYNHLPDRQLSLPATRRKRVLLVDQVRGDRSVVGSGADAETFRRMWMEARGRPDVEILVKVHPDVVAGHAEGYLTQIAYGSGARFIDEAISPHAVLDAVDEVWTVSSQMGFDALLRGLPVVTFGVPAYSGWGFTEDHATGSVARLAFGRRTRRLDIDEFVAAALLRYACYVDPVTRRRTDAEQAIDRLVAWRRRVFDLKGNYICVGFSRHKRKIIRRYLESPRSRVEFRRSLPMDADEADRLVVWGNGEQLSSHGKTVVRVEDGFIRSAGLGAALVPPSSLCFDTVGIYFDATCKSGLEHILETMDPDDALLQRARRVRQAIVELGVTKYNLSGGPAPLYRRQAKGRQVVVVAGQVPDDASLRFGIPCYDSNIALLRAVRERRPDAYLVYKEHPDLLFGGRRGRSDRRALLQYANLVVGRVDVCELLAAADEIHVATSQFGFEALIRQRPVWCYGMPFYAGWGLTSDAVTPLRPRRRLTLDTLVAGSLILYPRYMSWPAGLPCEIEDVLEALRDRQMKQSLRLSRLRRSSVIGFTR